MRQGNNNPHNNQPRRPRGRGGNGPGGGGPSGGGGGGGGGSGGGMAAGNVRRQNVPLRHQTFDSNGPEGRIRGNAFQVHEKYLALARDATAAGDRIAAENLYQHAEHYFRIMNAITEAENAHRPRPPHGHNGPGNLQGAPQPSLGAGGSGGNVPSSGGEDDGYGGEDGGDDGSDRASLCA